MTATQIVTKNYRCPNAPIKNLYHELNSEDSELRSHLLEAALTGMRLTRAPKSSELRRAAANAWHSIEPTLLHHLYAEDDVMLSWLEGHTHLSPEVLYRVRECHRKLRELINAIDTSRFERAADPEAIAAGRALCRLAVSLDDAIEAEQYKVFPAIQKAVFEMDHGAGNASPTSR